MDQLTYTVLSPFSYYKWEQDEELPGGVVFTRLESGALARLEEWHEILSKREVDRFAASRVFLRCDRLVDPIALTDSAKQDEIIEPILETFLGFQIVAPFGGEQTVVLCINVDRQLQPVAVFGPRCFRSLPWLSRGCFDTELGTALIPTLKGINQVVSDTVPRILTPLRLLEHAFLASTARIRLLFCAMGLDALLMAGTGQAFERRLCRLLGEDSFALPMLQDGTQPGLRVADVARDIYELRNHIAHGRNTPPRYQAAFMLGATSGDPLTRFLDAPRYGGILEQCALNLLCCALKKVFCLDLIDTVRNERRWRQYLEVRSGP